MQVIYTSSLVLDVVLEMSPRSEPALKEVCFYCKRIEILKCVLRTFIIIIIIIIMTGNSIII